MSDNDQAKMSVYQNTKPQERVACDSLRSVPKQSHSDALLDAYRAVRQISNMLDSLIAAMQSCPSDDGGETESEELSFVSALNEYPPYICERSEQCQKKIQEIRQLLRL
jgi:hypothetical protein